MIGRFLTHSAKKIFPVSAIVAFFLLIGPGIVHAAYNSPNLISDPQFNNVNVMSAADIQTFLNNENSGIRTLSDVENCSPPTPTAPDPYSASYYPHCGTTQSAATIIYDAAHAYGISPRVILATMQKEQSLVTDPTPWQNNLTAVRCAMGYNSCGSFSGFFVQVDNGTWALRTYVELMNGRSWWGYAPSSYPCSDAHAGTPSHSNGGNVGPGALYYSTGLYPGRSVTFYDYNGDPYTTITLADSATAALYCYTPHVYPGSSANYFSGSYWFVYYYEQWWGSTIFAPDSVSISNVSQPDTTPALGQTIHYVVSYHNNLSDSLTFDAGIVGRLGNLNGANRDFGWRSVTLAGGATTQVDFSATVQDLGSLYVWPAIAYQGIYVHDNQHGALLDIHVPNLGATISQGATSPAVGQSDTLSATISNFEGQDIAVDAAGIPVRYLGRYSYDTGWAAGSIINAGGSKSVSGPIVYDKPGSYTEWVSVKIGNYYVTVSPTTTVNAVIAPSTQNIQLSYNAPAPNTNPALGEDVTVSFNLKNNTGSSITLDAVGIVGRYNDPYNGANRDFGWVGPSSSPTNTVFTAGQTKTFAFTSTVSQLDNFYAWIAINYHGTYVHYNNWGMMLIPHVPNLSLSGPLTINGGSPAYGSSNSVTATIKNNEPNPVNYSSVGIPARFYGVYSYDTAWQGAGTITSGGTVPLSGSITFDKHGPYTVWVSINIQGRYITVGAQQNLNL